jgi:hypothetical protein
MSTIFNEDFREFIQALNDNNVEYIVVRGYAVILHGYRRVTGDLDIWVNRTIENYSKLAKAFSQFRLPVFDMTLQNFLDVETADVFSFGRSPVRIDILTKLAGVHFDDAFLRALHFDENGLMIRFIHLNNLLEAKKAAGRFKDLDDIEKLSSGNDLSS